MSTKKGDGYNFYFNKILMHLVLIPALTVFLIFIFSCAHQNNWAKRIDWEEFEFSQLPGQKEYPNAGAVIILDEGKMEISPNKQMYQTVFERHRIVKVLNTEGQRFANIAIPYSSDSFVDQIKARTISPEGKICVLDKKNIFDISLYPNFIFFSDQRAKIFTMPAVDNGAVIEYSYQLKFPTTTLGHSWSFQNDVPTLVSRFTLLEPLDLDIDYRLYGIDLEPQIKKAPAGFKSSYIWESKNLPALKLEFAMPQQSECIAHLKLAPIGIKKWGDVSLWYSELAEPQIKAGESVKRIASQIINGATTNIEKLKLIYQWVRDHVRYIAVSIGIGGFQPHAAEEILTNRYGDCKDMSTLLCSLAREAGLETYEVLISTWYNGKADTSLPSPYHFNHVIAYCPSVADSGVWMDATEKGCQFGKLPWYDQGLPVLIVGKNGEAKILFTPHDPADSNFTSMVWNVDLAETGAATIQGETKLYGAFATEMREDLLFTSVERQKQWLETYLAKKCSGIRLKSYSINGLSPLQDPLTISYTFFTETFALLQSQNLIFCPGDILAFDLPDYFRSEDRSHAIQFRYGANLALNLRVNLPEGWQVKNNKSDTLTTNFGKMTQQYSVSGNELEISTKKLLFGKRISKENYHDFQNFLDEARKKDEVEVIVVKK